MNYLKTREVMGLLGVSLNQVVNLIRHGRIERPAKDASGDLIWTPRDIAAARQALRAIEARKARRTPAAAEVSREG
jgi:hypothetical protein